MSSFLFMSSVLGMLMAVLGFYSSVRLDLPLGPTDVALGCCLIFLTYAFNRARLKAKTTVMCLALIATATLSGCSTKKVDAPVPVVKAGAKEPIALAKVKNSTGLPLVLPGSNPLRSLGEMAGKISPEYRDNVMDLLRDSLRQELERNGYRVTYTEQSDARFPPLSAETGSALRLAREGRLTGLVFVSEIRRWEAESQKFVRALIDFKLIRIDDGAVLWERRVQRAISTPSATNVGQASTDAVREIVRDLFAA